MSTGGGTWLARRAGGPVSWSPHPRGMRLSGWVGLVAAAQAGVLLAVSTRYGYHRDELYFIAAGSHPAFGYPDQPPLVPLLCWALNGIAPGSLLLLRAPSALAAAATTVLAALIAREVGGGVRAQVIAAACTACSAFALAVAHLVSTTTFDMLSTTLMGWLVIRAVVRDSDVCLLAAGVVVGLGVEAKPQVALVALVMAATLMVVGQRSALWSWGALAGAVAALGLAAPYAIWQQQHGWPQLTVAGNIAGTQEGGRAGFFPFQLVMVSVLLVPVWVAGLVAPWRRAGWRRLRFVPISYAVMAVLYFAGNGHAYYLASLYPVLLGLGAAPTAAWTRRGAPGRGRLLAAAIAVSATISAVIALPLLPERQLQGSIVMALNPAQGETVGWPRFVQTVSTAWQRIPHADRGHTAIFTSNYGEAGAIDLLGKPLRLPPAYSGHNGFSQWGPPSAADTRVLLLGFDAADATPFFDRCHTLATINDAVGLQNQEQGLPVMVCHPTLPWPRLWPRLRHYN